MVTNGEDEAKSAWQQVLLPVQGIGSMDRGMQFAGALLSRPFDAVSTFKSTAPGRGTSSYSEGEDWKTLESEWAKYYRKWKSTEEVGSFVAAIMKLEKEWIWHWRPEERKHAVGRSIELAGILSEKDDRKQAGIAEPIVSLQQAIAESRESVKQYYMATRGDTEDQANKRVDAFLKRQDKLIANWQAEGMSDHHIAEFLSDANETDRRYAAKLDAKNHVHSAIPGQAPKTTDESAQEFAKHAPKLPADPQELIKRPTGHPDGHFHPGPTGLPQPNLGPPGQGSSRR